jgi:hypothetical protein
LSYGELVLLKDRWCKVNGKRKTRVNSYIYVLSKYSYPFFQHGTSKIKCITKAYFYVIENKKSKKFTLAKYLALLLPTQVYLQDERKEKAMYV